MGGRGGRVLCTLRLGHRDGGASVEGVRHLLVISERVGDAPASPDAHRHHLDAFEAEEADPGDEEPVLEPVEAAAD